MITPHGFGRRSATGQPKRCINPERSWRQRWHTRPETKSRWLIGASTSEPATWSACEPQRPGRSVDPPRSHRRSVAFPLGIFGRERPRSRGGKRVKTRGTPRTNQALGLGGRSHPRPCCPVRHRRPGGDERNSKRRHGIGESGVCASSGVHCVHRPPTSHPRSSTAQVVGF